MRLREKEPKSEKSGLNMRLLNTKSLNNIVKECDKHLHEGSCD